MQTENFRQPERLFAPSPDTATPNRSPLTVQCTHTPDGKLQRKTERLDGNTDEYAYAFDSKGRLTDVRLNGHPLETYRYNASGQRILQVCRHGGLRQNERQYRYNSNGALTQAGRAEFYYDRNGALGQRCDDGNTISFEYGNGSRLDTARRRDGWEIRYEYGLSSPQPIRRFKYGRLIHEYVWLDATRLSVCRDHDEDIEYQFFYDANGKLDRLRLVNLLYIDPRASGGLWGNPLPAGSAEDRARLKAARLDSFYEAMARNNRKSPRSLFDDSYTPREFLCCTDQVGTLRALVAPNGAVIKEIKRDSFGIPYYDSFPGFVLPIGFAGGLTDPDTGLVRFGWRDYDPMIGRFTSLDPAKDRRGDGDLYDYCQDDPVSRVDPTGLWSKENFDESKVSRNHLGQFASTGSAGAGSAAGGTTPQSGSGWLVADAGRTASDAPGWLVADNSKPVPDNQSKAAAEAEQYTQEYNKLKFPANEYKRFNPDDPNDPNSRKNDPDFLKYGIHPDLPAEMVRYHAEVSDTTLKLGEKGILAALGTENIYDAVRKLTNLLKDSKLPPEKRIQLKNELALLVLGENAYGVYARNMAVLASNTSTTAKNLARQTISSLGEAKYHFSEQFTTQQRKMAADWSVNLSNPAEKPRLAALARRVQMFGQEKGWTDAKRAAMKEFLEAAYKQAGMPQGIKITIGRTNDPNAMAATNDDGSIVFNENYSAVREGNIGRMISSLFHEVGHSWYYKERNNTTGLSKMPERDRLVFGRPRFQDGWVDQSLYESSPDEAHSRMIESYAKSTSGTSFSEYWGLSKEAKI